MPTDPTRSPTGTATSEGTGGGVVVDRSAGPVVAAVLARYPRRDRLAAHLEAARDPRREHSAELLSVVNGWSAPERLGPVLGWFLTALRFH